MGLRFVLRVVGAPVLAVVFAACTYDFAVGSGATRQGDSEGGGVDAGSDGPPSSTDAGDASVDARAVDSGLDLPEAVRCENSCPCSGGQTCNFTCGDDIGCTEQCNVESTCGLSCSQGLCNQVCDGATCTFDCAGGDCNITCNSGATCLGDCGGGDCDYFCNEGAKCNMTCSGHGCMCSGPGCP